MHKASEALVILEGQKSLQDLWLRGKMQWEIARDLGISKRTVIRDLRIIIDLGREWVKERQGGDLWVLAEPLGIVKPTEGRIGIGTQLIFQEMSFIEADN